MILSNFPTKTITPESIGAIPNPSGGTTGQVLTKTSTGEEWSDAPSGLPEGGTEGQVIKKTADGAEWDNADWLPLSGGTMSGDINMADPTSDYDPSITANGIKNSTSPWIQWNVGDPGKHNLRIGTGDGYIKFTPESDGGSCFVDLNSGYNISVNTGLNVSDNLWVGGSNGIGFGEQPYSDKLYLYRNNEALSLKGNGETAIRLENVASPTNTNDAVPLGYLNTQLSTKLTTPTGTQGQLLGFTADNVVGAVDAPESGLTQEQADARYLQLTGGTVTNTLNFNIGSYGFGTMLKATTQNGDVGIVANDKQNVTVMANGLYVQTDGGITASKKVVVQGDLDEIKTTSVTVTLTADGWVDATAVPPPDIGGTTVTQIKQQTVTVSGVSATETAQLITPTPAIASQSAYYEAGIMCTNQAENSLTFTCQTVPTRNLTVYVVIQPLSYLN